MSNQIKEQQIAAKPPFTPEEKGGDFFALSPAAVPIIVDESSPYNLIGFFNHPTPPEAMDRIAEVFQTGIGPTYDDQGIKCACTIKRLTAPGHGMASHRSDSRQHQVRRPLDHQRHSLFRQV